jgi:hypothetical protein
MCPTLSKQCFNEIKNNPDLSKLFYVRSLRNNFS